MNKFNVNAAGRIDKVLAQELDISRNHVLKMVLARCMRSHAERGNEGKATGMSDVEVYTYRN